MQKTSFVLCLLFFISTQAIAQHATLLGTVIQDDNDEPLPGAHVYFQGTTTATATNNKGEYSIKKINPGSYNLVVSFSGFKRIKKNVTLKSGENKVDFKMEKSINNLDEVVVTGTGTAHRLKTVPVPTELISQKAIISTGA